MFIKNKIFRVADLPNNRSRKLAWMQENYCWHLIFTDPFSCTRPKWNYLSPEFSFMQTNFGNNSNEQCPQGPPIGATTNAK